MNERFQSGLNHMYACVCACICVCVYVKYTLINLQGQNWSGERRGQSSHMSVTNPSRHLGLPRPNEMSRTCIIFENPSTPSACGLLQCVLRCCVFSLFYLFGSLWSNATAVLSRSTSVWFSARWKWGKCVFRWVCVQPFWSAVALIKLEPQSQRDPRQHAGVLGPHQAHKCLL